MDCWKTSLGCNLIAMSQQASAHTSKKRKNSNQTCSDFDHNQPHGQWPKEHQGKGPVRGEAWKGMRSLVDMKEKVSDSVCAGPFEMKCQIELRLFSWAWGPWGVL